ncbi:BnaA09g03630D [Brassica napus]|uniref:BnaA09g03630D protein n=1 Tax=Brassica napus TaxID=3708 RepID=A0A078FZE3_BRANA|nr:BnaA09g03630D [Brassica napus]
MKGIKEENVVNEFRVRGECLHSALDKVNAHASDVLLFSVQWKDLNEYLESVKGKLKERFRELESKEVELKGQSFALEERAKVVEEAEAKVADLEMKSDGIRMDVEAMKKELNFFTKQVEVSVGESNAEEVRLSQLRRLVEECEEERMLKESQLGLKGEELAKLETDIERCCAEVSAEMESLRGAQTHRRQLDEEVERKTKDLTLVQSKLEKCEKLFETRSSELVKTQDELECKREDLGQMEAELERHRVKAITEKEHWERTRDHGRELEEEISRKKKELESVIEQLDSKQKLLETQSSELVSKEKEFEALSLDIGLSEQKVMSLNNDMKEICQRVESKGKELEKVQRLIKERSVHCESLKLLIEERSEELDSKVKQHDEITDDIRKLSLEIVFKEKTLKRAEVFIQQLSEKQDSAEEKLDSTRRDLASCIDEHESMERDLISVKDIYRECLEDLEIKEKELKSVESILTERNKEVEEREKMMQHLNSSIEKLMGQLKLKQEEVCSIKKTIKECSHFQGLELKEKELSAREARIDHKAQQLISTEQKLPKSSKKTELKAKKQGNTVQQADLVRDANVRDEKTLQLLLRGHLKKRDQLHLDVLSSIKRSSDPAKLVLETVNGLYAAHQRTEATNLDPKSVQRSSICLLECLMDMSPNPTAEVQGEAFKFATEWKNITLVEAENPVEVLEFLNFLAAFSFAYAFDADQVQSLFDVDFLCKYGLSLCKALGVSALAPVNNNVLSLEDKPEQQPREAPVINSSDPCSLDVQQSIASPHLPDEDSLRDIEDSTSFSPNEVSTKLRMLKYPGRFVLTCLDDALIGARRRGELSLAEPIVKTFVPLLEELARGVVSTDDPGLQSDATKVAREWVRMMGASVEKSELEVWAFLQFIVAFGLRIQPDQNLQLASRVTHFKQAPRLFQSLGLSDAIPNFVTQLLDKAIYIPAIRFMLYFNVTNSFSPLEFLKEQIISLRRSAKEKRTTHESQADAATMRDIMELIEDFQLEIDIPVSLILRFMVPRDIQNLPVQSNHAQASDTIFQSSCIATDGSNPSNPTSFDAAPDQPVDVETYEAGGSTEFQGQSSHHAGSKRPRVVEDPEGSRPVIRPCFNRPPGSG